MDNPSSWTWLPHWVLPGESMAGILYKFAYANALDGKAIKAVFTDSISLQKQGSPFYAFPRSQLDLTKLSSIVGLDQSKIWRASLGDLLEAVGFSQIVSNRLRYCHKCMEFGYHARYFQVLALAECPIHHIPLREYCPSCGAETPFYGFCDELFRHCYSCPYCEVPFSGKRLSIRQFFHPGITPGELEGIWHPIKTWITTVARSKVCFATLREWVTARPGKYQREREFDALHLVATLFPLPSSLKWRRPYLKRKILFLHSSAYRCHTYSCNGGSMHDAYVETLHEISRRLSRDRLGEINRYCKDNSWSVFDYEKSGFRPGELAYIAWRMKFENLADPALLGWGSEAKEVFVVSEQWGRLFSGGKKSIAKILFWVAYTSYTHDFFDLLQTCDKLPPVILEDPFGQCCTFDSLGTVAYTKSVVVFPLMGKF